MTKQELRKQVREAKRQLSDAQREAWSARIVETLLASEQLQQADVVLLYHPLPDEADVRPLFAALASQGKTVLLPRVTSHCGAMELRRYTGAADLAPGAFGILEPTGTLFTHYALIDLAIIPGMAFDPQGHRLGRGRGYYDRLLPQLTRARKVGVCLPFQLVDHVPTEAHDVTMDEVVTVKSSR